MRILLWTGLAAALAGAAALVVLDRTAPAPSPVAQAGERTPRAPLVLLTGLPIIWGEGDINATLSGARRPAAAYLWLDRRYALSVIDRLEPAALKGQRMMLLAQPPALAPEELVALDAWVRAGGRVLILADPSLRWPSIYPFGDPRAPPAITLLDPLLDHWGLRIDLREPGDHPEPIAVPLEGGGEGAPGLTVLAPGRFVTADQSCAIEAEGLIARCSIGKGSALLIADADLLADPLWGCVGASDEAFAQCNSGNAAALRILLDRLSGISGVGISRDGPG